MGTQLINNILSMYMSDVCQKTVHCVGRKCRGGARERMTEEEDWIGGQGMGEENSLERSLFLIKGREAEGGRLGEQLRQYKLAPCLRDGTPATIKIRLINGSSLRDSRW